MSIKVWLIHRRKWLLAAIALVVGFGLLAQGIAYSQNYMLDQDFFSFWLAGRMILTGQDPYSSTQWIAGHIAASTIWISDPTFLYPLPLAILLIPFGLLPLDRAAVLWAFLMLVFLTISMALLISTWKPKPRIAVYLLPGLAGLLVFRPAISTMLNGQLGALWVLILSLCVFWWEKGQWRSGGFALALLALKPSSGMPLIGLIGFWLFLNRRWSALGAVGLGGLGLLLAGWSYNPAWIDTFWRIANQKLSSTFGYSPTIWGLTAVACQDDVMCVIASSTLIGVLLVIACFILLTRPGFKAKPSLAISCILPVVLLTVPYLWIYDQILLMIPLLVVMHLMLEREWPYLLPALLFPVMAILSWLLIAVAMGIGRDAWSALVPAACIAMLLAFGLIPLKSTRA